MFLRNFEPGVLKDAMGKAKYPRQDLSFTCNRRQFFRALFQEVVVIRGSLQGRPGYRLSELGSLPDRQLAQVKPVVNRDYEIFVEQGDVWARYKLKERSPLKLFSVEEKEDRLAFNLFDGRHSLGEIGSHLVQEMEWDEARAFAHVRDLFLSLIEPMVCLPKDPLEFNE